MTNQKKHSLKTKKKDHSKRYVDPPCHAEVSLCRDVRRKHEEIEKSTIGGY